MDYQFGFCMDGNKDCIFMHQKVQGSQEDGFIPQVPTYKSNECLPKEYLEKVKDYFDDSKITNVNMIQTLMKQMTQRLTGGGMFGNSGANDAYDIHSLMGGGGRQGGFNLSNTDTLTLNSGFQPHQYSVTSHYDKSYGKFKNQKVHGGFPNKMPSQQAPYQNYNNSQSEFMGEFEGGYMTRRHDSLAVSGME